MAVCRERRGRVDFDAHCRRSGGGADRAFAAGPFRHAAAGEAGGVFHACRRIAGQSHLFDLAAICGAQYRVVVRCQYRGRACVRPGVGTRRAGCRTGGTAPRGGTHRSAVIGSGPYPFRCAGAVAGAKRRAGGDAIVEDMGKNARTQNALRLRVLIPFPAHGEKFLQLMRTVPAPLARNMQEAQRAWRDYQIKKLGRTGLRKMYIGTLTLALFFASFLAMILALVLGNQLTRPLFLLAQGTREVARGDYTPKREIRSKDELGFLTQSFNAMTRQLSDARAAVERNRNALEQAKAYLESVLANLSAGVFVFDRQFRLNIANAGAQRILRQSFQPQLSRLLDEITGLNAFGALVRKAFAERAAA